MADTPGQDPELENILTDLDAILSDLNPAPETQAALTPAPPLLAKPSMPKPVPAPTPAPAPDEHKIELAPRAGTIPAQPKKPAAAPPPAKTPGPLRPPLGMGGTAVTSAAAPAPAPVPQAKPAPVPPAAVPVPASVTPSNIPVSAAPDQIRRVALVFGAAHQERAEALVAFLDQSALTISKRPLFMRRMCVEAVSENTDANILAGRLASLGVVAVIGVLESLPDAKLRDLESTFTATGLFFRNVAAAEAQKRSVAVDLIVDMLLLKSEA